ncbi:MAG: hypothetical protein ABI763_01600 [Bacteroidota bacterium]
MYFDFKSQGKKILLLTAALIALSIFFFHGSITLFPSFIHAWTQSDRYALALGFLHNGLDFFHPETYNLLTINGITRVDFPIHEYIVALIMKITGIHEPVVFRVYTLIYALTGLVFLFRLSMLFVENVLKNYLIVLFLFLCPVYLYYADGFLPSIPSLSNLFIGYYFYFRYRKEKSKRDFNLAITFLTLAALSRMTFFIFLFAVFCQQLLNYFSNRKVERKELKGWIISFSIFGGYQLYNAWLGKKYGTQFLVSFLPPGNVQQLRDWIMEAWINWRFQYFTPAHYMFLGILLLAFIFIVIREKSPVLKSSDLLLQLAICTIGSLIYFILLLKQFPDHDYYFIDAFYPVAMLLLIYLMSYTFKHKIANYLVTFLLAACLVFSFSLAKEVNQNRYFAGNWDRVEISRINFQGAERFLDSVGVAKDAKVLVLDGYTTNVPFILMNRKGWTVNWTTIERIEEGMSKPFDIVAIQNSFVASDVLKNDSGLATRLQKFADNGLISLYKRKEVPNQSFDQFFGIDSSFTYYENIIDTLNVEAASEYIDLYSDTAPHFSVGQPIKILVTGKIRCNNEAPRLIASVSKGIDVTSYFSFELNEYITRSEGWQNMLFQFVIPAQRDPPGSVKVYLWNNEKVPFQMKDLRLVVYR